MSTPNPLHPPQPVRAPALKQIKLSPDEAMIITMLREKKHQEVLVKIQDGVVVYVERTEKFKRKAGGLNR